MRLAKIESLKELIDSVKLSIGHSIKNPSGGAPGHTQEKMLKELMTSVEKLIDKMDK